MGNLAKKIREKEDKEKKKQLTGNTPNDENKVITDVIMSIFFWVFRKARD